jgi:acetyltransferase-like isoleucine patch superfamily enzyme
MGSSVGDGTYGIPTVKFANLKESGKLKIGKFCSISDKVEILMAGEHNYKLATTFPFDEFFTGQTENTHRFSNGDVTIGNDVWIGHDVLILSGVTIPDGCIIGAGTVLRKSIQSPYSIVCGNPAKVVKKRFSKDIVDKMMLIKWWDWPMDRIKSEIPFLLSDAKTFVQRNHP